MLNGVFVFRETCFNRDRWVLRLNYVLDNRTLSDSLRRLGLYGAAFGSKASVPQLVPLCRRKVNHENRGQNSLAWLVTGQSLPSIVQPNRSEDGSPSTLAGLLLGGWGRSA